MTLEQGVVKILAFGQIAEILGGRHHSFELSHEMTVEDIIQHFGLEEWIDFGLSVAINGTRVGISAIPCAGDELALLPPVSGG